MSKIEPFEKYTRQYEDWFETHTFVYESELQAIKDQLPSSEEGIEIGVGSGRFAAPLGIKLGIEPSAKMREIAQRRGIEVIDGVAENLPFRDKKFHFILMVTTICFLNDIKTAFQEVHRVLKPRGCLIVGFIDKTSTLGELYQKHKKTNVFYNRATFYSVEDVVFHLKRIGFKKFHFTQTIFHKLNEINDIEPIKEGYGEGSFVVVKTIKKNSQKKKF
ncbi:MAG: class I SAM-dependent methyltransferase [Promethearchaeota archaeon]